DLSWEDLSLKKIPPPFVPKIENDVDVSNFSEEKLEKKVRGMFADPTQVSRTLIICNNILTETPPVSGDLSAEISDFIGKLLTKYPAERLGSGEEDAGELKRHPFFRDLSWEDLSLKKIPPPFVPKIENDVDVSNFSEEFTDMTPTDSPAVVPPNSEALFKVKNKEIIPTYDLYNISPKGKSTYEVNYFAIINSYLSAFTIGLLEFHLISDTTA
ncbi:Ribosomal protein S6 kinase alpha-5, partial [Blattella germanica]